MRYIGRSENAPQPTFEARTVASSSLAELFERKNGEAGVGARSPSNTRVVKLQTYDDDGDDDPADNDAEAEHAGESSRPHQHHHHDDRHIRH